MPSHEEHNSLSRLADDIEQRYLRGDFGDRTRTRHLSHDQRGSRSGSPLVEDGLVILISPIMLYS
jgi:hypothetical protein